MHGTINIKLDVKLVCLHRINTVMEIKRIILKIVDYDVSVPKTEQFSSACFSLLTDNVEWVCTRQGRHPFQVYY
jgi:hypothetical protein